MGGYQACGPLFSQGENKQLVVLLLIQANQGATQSLNDGRNCIAVAGDQHIALAGFNRISYGIDVSSKPALAGNTSILSCLAVAIGARVS